MKILLDFDGVIVTTPTWQTVEHLNDGFMAFNKRCVNNLSEILAVTQADTGRWQALDILLTSK